MELRGMEPPEYQDKYKSEHFSVLNIVFRRLGVSPNDVVDIKKLSEEFNALEAESGASLFSPEESEGLAQFSSRFSSAKFDLDGVCKLLHQIASEPLQNNNNSGRVLFDIPNNGLSRKGSLLSVRTRANPLPETTTNVATSPFVRPESPSQAFLSRSLSVASGSRSPFFRHERSVSALDKNASPKLTRNNSIQSLNFSPSPRCRSPIELDSSELNSEPSPDRVEREHNIERRQVRRVTSELNKRLEEAETNMSKMAQEASKRISRLESELSASKSEVNQKRKLLFDLRSEIRVQSEQIESLEKDNADLKLGLSDFKTSYFQTKKQLEASRVQRLDNSASSKSRIEELEDLLRDHEKSQQDHQLLANRCTTMAKTISNLEKDVAIAQRVAKNFDELVQENFQLKESIESLQKSLVETFQPPASSSENFRGSSLVSELSRSALSCIEESTASPRSSGSWMFSGPLVNSRQLKEMDKENRYLKRHIDKTWAQWDRVKSDLVTLVEATTTDPIEASKRRLGLALSKMDRYRPAKAYPNFKRASIQQILIDDRPAISSSEMTPVFSSPATFEFSVSKTTSPVTKSSPIVQETKRRVSISDCVSENSGSTLELSAIGSEALAKSSSEPSSDLTCQPSPSEKSTVLPESSPSALPSYLTRRANRKSGLRSIKKVSFIDLSTESLSESSDAFGSQPPPSPLPTQPSTSDLLSVEPTFASVISPNLLKIGDVPPHVLLGRSNSFPVAKRESETDSSTLVVKEGPSNESYVLLILYAIAAYFLTYWTSTTSLDTDAQNRRASQSPKSHSRSSSDNRVLRIPNTPSPSHSDQEESEDEEEAIYGDNSLLLLKFWFEMLVMGGTYPNE